MHDCNCLQCLNSIIYCTILYSRIVYNSHSIMWLSRYNTTPKQTLAANPQTNSQPRAKAHLPCALQWRNLLLYNNKIFFGGFLSAATLFLEMELPQESSYRLLSVCGVLLRQARPPWPLDQRAGPNIVSCPPVLPTCCCPVFYRGVVLTVLWIFGRLSEGVVQTTGLEVFPEDH